MAIELLRTLEVSDVDGLLRRGETPLMVRRDSIPPSPARFGGDGLHTNLGGTTAIGLFSDESRRREGLRSAAR